MTRRSFTEVRANSLMKETKKILLRIHNYRYVGLEKIPDVKFKTKLPIAGNYLYRQVIRRKRNE